MERRVQDYELGLDLESREDVDRKEVEIRIKEFLADFFAQFAEIALGKKPEWGMRLDQWFVRSFEHHILWPVKRTRDHLWAKAGADKTFDHHLQEWIAKEQGWLFTRNDPIQWREVLDRTARTLCYVFANRLIFYESVRAKFAELDALEIPRRSLLSTYEHFRRRSASRRGYGRYETFSTPTKRIGPAR